MPRSPAPSPPVALKLIPQASLIPTDAFADPRWRIIYQRRLRHAQPNLGYQSSAPNQLAISSPSITSIANSNALSTPPRLLSGAPGLHHTDTSLAYAASTRPLEYCLSELAHLYSHRQAANIGALLRRQCDGCPMRHRETSGDRELLLWQKWSPSPLIEASLLCQKPPPNPPEIIAGILHQGGKMAFGGGSKSFKTWTLLEMAICIATGSPWLGFATTLSNVLYLNFELPNWSVAKRLSEICHARDLTGPRKPRPLEPPRICRRRQYPPAQNCPGRYAKTLRRPLPRPAL